MNIIDGAGLPGLARDAGDDTAAAERAYAALALAPSRQRGKGVQYLVTTDAEAAAVIAGYCQSAGDALTTSTLPHSRTDAAVLLAAAERIRDTIKAAA